jgi:hypothetical protein
MTVGCSSGDAVSRDLATQTPVAAPTAGEVACSPERFSGSRFWVLQADDEEDGGLEDEREDGDGDGGTSAGVEIDRHTICVVLHRR